MTTDMKPARQDIEDRLKTMVDYLRDCEARVHRGEIISLQGLDSKVMEVCNDIAKLPREDARDMESAMALLIAELENLADLMRKQQEEFANPNSGKKDH